MIGIVGIIIIFAAVFGGYLASGGHLELIIHALPFELTIILGAAVGATVISNDMTAIKHMVKDIRMVFKGPKWAPGDYRDLLCLLFELIRIGRQNAVALEEHIERPQASPIFLRYARSCATTRRWT